MRVKAKDNFSYYRLKVLNGLSVEDFRALQQGKTVDIDKEIYGKNKHIFESVKIGSKAEVK